MSSEILLDRTIHVSYSTAQVGPGDDPGAEPEAYWQGQVNGLCGAAVDGWLSLVTGLHTGHVRLTIELHPAEPPLGDDWQEAVEVSLRHEAEKLWVGGLMSDAYPIELPHGDYRVRYCARGMEEGRSQDVADEDEVVDAYLLQLWPGDAESDRIVRQTSEIAAYRHRAHPGTTRSETVQGRRTRPRAATKPRNITAPRNAADRPQGEDRMPSDRLRKAARRANPTTMLDADVVSALAEADDDMCIAVARWAAERAVAVAGLRAMPWVVEALAAMDRGEPLPPPFPQKRGAGAPTKVWQLLDDAGLPGTTVTLPTVASHGQVTELSQQHVALPAVFATADRSPLVAAMNALWAAANAHGEDGYRRFFIDLRTAFPSLAH